ncbi:hypothetical protein [Desulfovibrio sp. SGI.169]|uniref:hypothetical protein n=1 Tax=Desulfovibrio sp. SGI.169 TaxID=3420561 RepID=UPI003D02BC6A
MKISVRQIFSSAFAAFRGKRGFSPYYGAGVCSRFAPAVATKKPRMETAISYRDRRPPEPLALSVSRQGLLTATAAGAFTQLHCENAPEQIDFHILQI